MIVKAGEKAGVSHYIWSTLEDTIAFFGAVTEDQPPKIKDEFYVPHFDGKAAANSAFPKDKVTLFYTSFYLENFWNFGNGKGWHHVQQYGRCPLAHHMCGGQHWQERVWHFHGRLGWQIYWRVCLCRGRLLNLHMDDGHCFGSDRQDL